jgi:hypothetical protein
LITKNESIHIYDCISSLKDWVDELVVVDTGSTDDTPELARELGARVLHHSWQDDFSAARNAAVEAATGDWVLVLDADERLAPGAGPLIREAIQRADTDAFLLPLHQASDETASPEAVLSGRARLHEPTLLYRLLRRTPDLRWRGIIHEGVDHWLAPRLHRVRALEAAIVHYGAVPALRQRLGKDERNLRLLRRRCALDPDDIAGRAYLAGHLAAAGDQEGAERALGEGWGALERAMQEEAPRPPLVQLASQRARLLLSREDLAGLEATLRRVLAFLGEPWEPAVLDHRARPELPAYEAGSASAARPIFTGSLERWRSTLSPAQVAEVQQVAGELIALL